MNHVRPWSHGTIYNSLDNITHFWCKAPAGKNVKKELSSDKQEEQESTSTSETVNKDNTANKIEQKMKDKVLEQVPGVKRVIDAKKKVDKVKDIVK